MKYQEILESYLKYVRASNKSDNYVKNARSVLTRYCHWASGYETITPEMVCDYFVDTYVFESKELMAKTANTRCTAYSLLKAFFIWLKKHKYTSEDLISLVPVPKQPKAKPKAIDDKTMTTLNAKIKALPLKYQTVVLLIRDLGLRAEEALSLSVDAVVMVPGGAHINVIGKGQKPRIVPLTDNMDSYKALKEYLRRGKNHFGPLFPGDKGERIHYNTLRKYWTENVSNKHTIHQLRHTACTQMVTAGIPIDIVSEFMGHSSLGTTQRYAKLYGKRYMDTVKRFQTGK